MAASMAVSDRTDLRALAGNFNHSAACTMAADSRGEAVKTP